jgi:cyclopropane-fatty-acyl-phospholipid synthase
MRLARSCAACRAPLRREGLTGHLFRETAAIARLRIFEEGLEKQVTVELRDYRDLQGNEVYEKIASIGMFEQVGLESFAALLRDHALGAAWPRIED